MAIGAIVGQAIGYLLQFAQWMKAAGEDALALFPQNRHVVTVRVYGDSNSTRDGLTLVALAIASFRLNGFQSSIPLGGWFYNTRNFRLTHDIMNKYVELSVGVTTGPLATLLGAGALPGLNPMPNMEYVPNVTGNNTTVNPFPRSYNPGFPGTIPDPLNSNVPQQQAARGAYLASLVSASLAPTYQPNDNLVDGANSFHPTFNDVALRAPLPNVQKTP